MNTFRFRKCLPTLDKFQMFTSHWGLLTELLFKTSFKIPDNLTAIHLLEDEDGLVFFKEYFKTFGNLAVSQFGIGYLLEHAASWKMNFEMATRTLGYTEERWAELFQKSIQQLLDVRQEIEENFEERGEACPPILIGVDTSAREGGYEQSIFMTPEEAEKFHYHEVKMAADIPAVDYITAYTICDPNEAIGLTWAAQKLGLPIVISFVVQKVDLKLRSGHTLKEAIEQVDGATNKGPIYYMINCCHPKWLIPLFKYTEDPWVKRIAGIKGNGSLKSHDELDNSGVLDDGDPVEFGIAMGDIFKKTQGRVNVISGCCGTDARHLNETFKNILKQISLQEGK